MKKITQEDVWNKVSDDWKNYREKPRKDVVDFLKNKEGKILDLGCGSGRHFIKIKGLHFYGTDFSEKMMEYAKLKAHKLKIKVVLKKSPVDKIPFDDNFFDASIFISALHCLTTNLARKNSLKELIRVLKPNGEAMISVLSKGHSRVKNKLKDISIPWTVKGKKYSRYYYVYEKKELENLLKEVGFKILDIFVWKNKNIIAIIKKP